MSIQELNKNEKIEKLSQIESSMENISNIINKNDSIRIKKEEEYLKHNSGRWSEEEHQKFIEGILEYGNEWKKVRKIIKTRTSTQARSHAQKFFLRIKKNICEIKKKKNKNFDENDNNTFFNYIINFFSNWKKNKIELTQTQKEKLISVINYKFPNENKKELDIDSEEDDDNYLDNINFNRKKSFKGKNTHNKIFDIKKDFKHRNSMELPNNNFKNENKKNHLIINNNCEDNNINNIDDNKMPLTPINHSTNIYEEMQNLFSQKKRFKELQRQRFNSTSNEYDIDMEIFGDKNFFPQNNKKNKINYNCSNPDPFSIDFEKFSTENINHENNGNVSPYENYNDDYLKKMAFDYEGLSFNENNDIQME